MGLRTRLVALLAVFIALTLITSTGAFTTVSAERTVDVSVAGDDAALLQIEPHSGPNGDYAEQSGGEFQINFDNVSATGVNLDAKTTLGNVFNVTNQGTQTVTVTISKSGTYPNAVDFNSSDDQELDDGASGVDIGVGDTLEVTIEIDTTAVSPSAGETLVDSITIHAEAS